MMRVLCTGIVRPMLTYGSIVWAQAAAKVVNESELKRLNRLAATTWAHFRRSTPTAGLEIFGYLPPVDLFVKGEAIKAWFRIKETRQEKWDGIGNLKIQKGHRKYLTDSVNKWELKEYEWDDIPLTQKFHGNYDTDAGPRERAVPTPLGSTLIHTYGRVQKQGASASFIIRQGENDWKGEHIPLGNFPTSLQAKIFAISAAAQYTVHSEKGGRNAPPVVILSDSRMAIQMLDSPKIKSKIVAECTRILDKLGENTKVQISWTMAGLEPKLGTKINMQVQEMGLIGPEPCLPVTKNQRNRDIQQALEGEWVKRWQSRTDCRQSKMNWPKPDREKSLNLLCLQREQVGECIQMLSGHNFLKRHMFIAKEVGDPECRLCGGENNAEETSDHIIRECPALAIQRCRHLGKVALDQCDLGQWCIKNLSHFFSVVRETLDSTEMNAYDVL